jgi:hypothetical protein
VAFGVMIVILIIAWITLLIQLNDAFGNAMKDEKKVMGIMYTIFTFFLFSQTVYAFF